MIEKLLDTTADTVVVVEYQSWHKVGRMVVKRTFSDEFYVTDNGHSTYMSRREFELYAMQKRIISIGGAGWFTMQFESEVEDENNGY